MMRLTLELWFIAKKEELNSKFVLKKKGLQRHFQMTKIMKKKQRKNKAKNRQRRKEKNNQIINKNKIHKDKKKNSKKSKRDR